MCFDLVYLESPRLLRIVCSVPSGPESVGCGCWYIKGNLDMEAPLDLGTACKERKKRQNEYQERAGALITCLLWGSGDFFSRCCHLQSRVLWWGHRACGQHPVQDAWLQQAALSFLSVYSIWGANRREFIRTVKNHIPSYYEDAEILHTGNHTQPRIDFFLQLCSHGFLVISFCSLLLEDIYNTAALTFLFNRKPLDKGYLVPIFHIVWIWKFKYL